MTSIERLEQSGTVQNEFKKVIELSTIINPCQAKVNSSRYYYKNIIYIIVWYFILPLRGTMPSNNKKAYWASNFNIVLKYYVI